ncbi:MAG: TonB-dependent receptor [Verrucomicrobia bacterium]|nr:MAG: TonB-dependent receptor [Verrucomicrobiota bacterium]
MAKTLALLFGVVFLLIGILGFVPALAPNEMLLNIFHVNAAHNVVHLLTGVVALLAGMGGVGAARTFFRIFGVVYGLVAVLGFVVGDGLLLGLIANNMADTWLHVVIALVSLIIGFVPSGGTTASAF